MKHGALHKIILFCTIVLSAEILTAQILKNPDPGLKISRSNGIVAITPGISGSFFLNDYYLTDVAADDTVYIYNLKPGNYSVKFTTEKGAGTGDLLLEKGRVQAIKPSIDGIYFQTMILDWDSTISRMTGKKSYSPQRGCFYNFTHFAILNLILANYENQDHISFFTSVTTINGYQYVPGFCLGLGISYNYYPYNMMDRQDEDYYYYNPGKMEKGHFQFLPVFLDLRFHLPPASRQVTPFFKFDIGYNFLLKESHFHSLDSWDTAAFTFVKGGAYVSPGFGLRIFINELVQVTTTLEYSFEKSSYFINSNEQNLLNNKFNFLKLNLGISFQYK